jgi:hypothetical protein
MSPMLLIFIYLCAMFFGDVHVAHLYIFLCYVVWWFPCFGPALYSTEKSTVDKISSHLAILPLGSFKIKSQIKACWSVRKQNKTRKQSAEENAWTLWNNGYSHKELQSIQNDDPDIGPTFRWKECGSRPDRVELVKDSPTRHTLCQLHLVCQVVIGFQ